MNTDKIGSWIVDEFIKEFPEQVSDSDGSATNGGLFMVEQFLGTVFESPSGLQLTLVDEFGSDVMDDADEDQLAFSVVNRENVSLRFMDKSEFTAWISGKD